MSKNQRGFTLTEIAIVLCVIGMMMGGIWVAGASVSNNSKAQKANQQILTITSNFRSLFAAHGLDNAVASTRYDVTCMGVQNGMFPSEMAGTSCVTSTYNTYPVNPWNGYVDVATEADINSIIVTYHGLSQANCIRLASLIFPATGMTSQAIYNGATSVYSNFPQPPYGTNGPLTLAQIQSFCGNSNANYVQASYAIR